MLKEITHASGFSELAAVFAEGQTYLGRRSVAVVAGNRNLGLYFAALPADPLFALFVAAYQLPLYLTPMVAGWFADRSQKT